MRYYLDTSALITYYHEPALPEAPWLQEFIACHAGEGLLISRLTTLEYVAYLLSRRRHSRTHPKYLKPKRLRAALERLERDVSPRGAFRRLEVRVDVPWFNLALRVLHEHPKQKIQVCDALHLAVVLPHVEEIGLLTRDQNLRDVCDAYRVCAPRATDV